MLYEAALQLQSAPFSRINAACRHTASDRSACWFSLSASTPPSAAMRPKVSRSITRDAAASSASPASSASGYSASYAAASA